MDRISLNSRFVSVSPVFGKRDTCPIDQMPARSFNIDPYTGRPMEEITKVMRAQTAAEQQTAYLNLVQYKGDFLPDDTSAKTALKYMKPSLCQLPSELAEFAEYVADRDMQAAQKLKKEQEEKEYLEKLEKQLLENAQSSVEPKSE